MGLTPEAQAVAGTLGLLLARLPFRVGRDSRRRDASAPLSRDARRADSVLNNDLYIFEDAEVLNVSREHLLIERDGDGWALVDRGSTCGTIVEGRSIGGGHAGGRAPLFDGDVIVIGASTSPWIFKFRLS